MDKKLIGNRIKQAREEAHLSQESLAYLIGKTHPVISRLEAGKTQEIDTLTLDRLAQVLEKPPAWLLGLSGDHLADAELEAYARKIDRLPEPKRESLKRIIRALIMEDTAA